MGEELAKLLEAGFIREIKHPDWLANLVMVPKKGKSWRLCDGTKPGIIIDVVGSYFYDKKS